MKPQDQITVSFWVIEQQHPFNHYWYHVTGFKHFRDADRWYDCHRKSPFWRIRYITETGPAFLLQKYL